MSFLVFKGTLRVIHESDGFLKDATHGYVCVVADRELQRAIEAADGEAKKMGLAIATVDGTPMLVPAWRSVLWTAQGRELREAKRLGLVLSIAQQAVDPETVIGE
jgi:hypothetical protein